MSLIAYSQAGVLLIYETEETLRYIFIVLC